MNEEKKEIMLQSLDEHFFENRPNPSQEVFEIFPTHGRRVGTIGHVSKNKMGLVTSLLAIAGGMGIHHSLLGEQEERETFYDRHEKEKLSKPDFFKAEQERFDKAEAKRQRKNAKRLKYAS